MRMTNFTSLKSTLLAALFCIAGSATAQTELLQNTSFEEWNGEDPVHWVSTTTASNGTLSQSSDARTGSYSVMVKGTTSNQRLASEEMTLKAGTYTFSVYAKAATNEATEARPGYAPIKEDGSMGSYMYREDYVDVPATEWTLVSYNFTLAADTRLNLVVMNPRGEKGADGKYAPGKDLLLDDASLTTTDGGIVEGGESPEPDPEEPANESSKENPYSVAEALSKYNASVPQSDVWVSGYIVGYVTGNSVETGANFSAEAPDGGEVSASNLLIADDATVTDYTQCVVVQLPAGILREALNLQSNPENLGKQVVLKGSLEKYFSVCGLKQTSEYVLEGEESPDPSVDISNTPETAYTVAKAHELIEAGDGLATAVYIKGVITGIKEVSTSFGNATYFINDNGSEGEAITVFRGNYFDGARFTSEDQIKVGDEVVIYGKLTVYNGEHQVDQGSSIYSLNGETEPAPPSVDISNTPETAYTVAKAQELIQAGEGLETPVYVKGVITEIEEVSPSFGNATYYINDTETTEGQLCVYRGHYLEGKKFTAEDQIKKGDEVIVYGTLVLYGGDTPEITNSEIYSLNGETTTGITGITADKNAPVEVYTLGGVKVGDSLDGLQKGIYIVKQGNKVTKVIK